MTSKRLRGVRGGQKDFLKFQFSCLILAPRKFPKNGPFRVKKIVLLKRRPSYPLDLLAPLTYLLLLPITQVEFVELKASSYPPKRDLLDLWLLLSPPPKRECFF